MTTFTHKFRPGSEGKKLQIHIVGLEDEIAATEKEILLIETGMHAVIIVDPNTTATEDPEPAYEDLMTVNAELLRRAVLDALHDKIIDDNRKLLTYKEAYAELTKDKN